MSWNLGTPEIKGATIAEAKRLLVSNTSTPQSIKDYVSAGIEGLAARHGNDVLVTVTGHGHLCDVPNKDSFDVTSATLEVRKA